MCNNNTRPKVYDIIRENDVEHMRKVGWGGLDLFNLIPNEWSTNNSECVWYDNLTLVRDMNNDSDGNNVFIKHYFNHDGIQWYLSGLTRVCNLCDNREAAESERQGSKEPEDEE